MESTPKPTPVFAPDVFELGDIQAGETVKAVFKREKGNDLGIMRFSLYCACTTVLIDKKHETITIEFTPNPIPGQVKGEPGFDGFQDVTKLVDIIFVDEHFEVLRLHGRVYEGELPTGKILTLTPAQAEPKEPASTEETLDDNLEDFEAEKLHPVPPVIDKPEGEESTAGTAPAPPADPATDNGPNTDEAQKSSAPAEEKVPAPKATRGKAAKATETKAAEPTE